MLLEMREKINSAGTHLCSVVQLFAGMSLVVEAASTQGFQRYERTAGEKNCLKNEE
jgi:hypothetical protein